MESIRGLIVGFLEGAFLNMAAVGIVHVLNIMMSLDVLVPSLRDIVGHRLVIVLEIMQTHGAIL